MLTIEPLVALLDEFEAGKLDDKDTVKLFECLVQTGLIQRFTADYIQHASLLIASGKIKQVEIKDLVDMISNPVIDLENGIRDDKEFKSIFIDSNHT